MLRRLEYTKPGVLELKLKISNLEVIRDIDVFKFIDLAEVT